MTAPEYEIGSVPCQGKGREFEPRLPLHSVRVVIRHYNIRLSPAGRTQGATGKASSGEPVHGGRLRRGVFTSVADLTAAIEQWVAHWNDDPKPFVWHAPAAGIIEKVQRGRAALHQIKSATDQ